MSEESRPGYTRLPRNLGIRVGLLLGVTLVITIGFVLYVLYARGVFEATQRLTLIAEDAEGVSVGMDLTFSGFPIGRVTRLALAEDGKARIEIEVPRRDARWLRASTVFTLELSLVGGGKLRAYTANLQDMPLPDEALRPVLRGDTAAEIPRLVASLRTILDNVDQMTAPGASLQASLENVRTLTTRMAGKQGALAGILGSEDNATRVLATIERANALLGSLGGVSAKLDAVLSKTDRRVFGEGGVMDETQKAVAQANAILAELRENLKRVDAILANAQAASGNVKAATTDLAALRAEVEASLRKVAQLIDEINRKWPFERDAQIKLP
jgi:phospholipid/cholesterol/gamma-HCH transport system substrate-binding protein